MTQENRELLLKDLCARLPYGIKFKADNEEYIREIHYIKDENVYIREYRNLPYWIDTIKPYLRPLSSMTDEEREEYRKFSYYGAAGVRPYTHGDFVAVPSFEKMDYLNSHHFDYRGLIEKGLALKAPEGMYKK